MGELLDRGYQLQILEKLTSSYPDAPDLDEAFKGEVGNTLKVNLYYLQEHGLVRLVFPYKIREGKSPMPKGAQSTAKGMDFLAGDGGLTAILGIQTIRFDEEQFRQILIAKVRDSESEEIEKSSLISALEEIPANTLEKVHAELLGYALKKVPDAIEILKGILGMGS